MNQNSPFAVCFYIFAAVQGGEGHCKVLGAPGLRVLLWPIDILGDKDNGLRWPQGEGDNINDEPELTLVFFSQPTKGGNGIAKHLKAEGRDIAKCRRLSCKGQFFGGELIL